MTGAILALLALAAPIASASDDRVVAPELDRFVIGYQSVTARGAIREEVPEGESVKQWTRMVTTQRFTGLASMTTPENYVANVGRSVERACPGARVDKIRSLAMAGPPGGRAAVRLTVDCPVLAETGLRETFVMEATAGTFDMLVKQVAFRGAHTAADMVWANAFLDSLTYCAGGSSVEACTRVEADR